MASKKVSAVVACVAGMFSFCQTMEEKKGLPSFTSFFPESISEHKAMMACEQEAEAYAGIINTLKEVGEKPASEMLSVFFSSLEAWEIHHANIEGMEKKYSSQYADFIPGKTKIVTPDEEARKRALKVAALKAQEQALLKIKYPSRVECLFPFVVFKNDEKRQNMYRSILETIREESNMPLLKGETEGRISFDKLYSLLPSRVELSKALSFLSGLGKKVAMEKLDSDDSILYMNHMTLSLYQGDKDIAHIKWRVRTVNR